MRRPSVTGRPPVDRLTWRVDLRQAPIEWGETASLVCDRDNSKLGRLGARHGENLPQG